MFYPNYCSMYDADAAALR